MTIIPMEKNKRGKEIWVIGGSDLKQEYVCFQTFTNYINL